MSTRFLEAICSFDQVVPEIGEKKKSPCPIMVSDTPTHKSSIQTSSDHPGKRVSEPLSLQMPVTCEAC